MVECSDWLSELFGLRNFASFVSTECSLQPHLKNPRRLEVVLGLIRAASKLIPATEAPFPSPLMGHPGSCGVQRITIHSSIEHRGHLCTVYLFARHVSNLEDVADLDDINLKLHSWDRCSRNLAGICDCFSTPKDEGMSQCFFFCEPLTAFFFAVICPELK